MLPISENGIFFLIFGQETSLIAIFRCDVDPCFSGFLMKQVCKASDVLVNVKTTLSSSCRKITCISTRRATRRMARSVDLVLLLQLV